MHLLTIWNKKVLNREIKKDNTTIHMNQKRGTKSEQIDFNWEIHEVQMRVQPKMSGECRCPSHDDSGLGFGEHGDTGHRILVVLVGDRRKRLDTLPKLLLSNGSSAVIGSFRWLGYARSVWQDSKRKSLVTVTPRRHGQGWISRVSDHCIICQDLFHYKIASNDGDVSAYAVNYIYIYT